MHSRSTKWKSLKKGGQWNKILAPVPVSHSPSPRSPHWAITIASLLYVPYEIYYTCIQISIHMGFV